MSMQEERKCPHCKKVFYVNTFRFRCAKTLSCYYCKKRFTVKPHTSELPSDAEKSDDVRILWTTKVEVIGNIYENPDLLTTDSKKES